jgi:hypothetical protein
MATITRLAGDFRISFLTVTVPTAGTSVTNDTGLNGVYFATQTVTGTTQAANAPGFCTLVYATSSGNVAVYAWDDVGVVATAGGAVDIMAIGK